MAGPAPKTEKWTARENAHKPAGVHVIVSGNVQVADADKAPVLTKGQSKDPNLLPLELTIVTCSDPSIAVEVWKEAQYHEVVKPDQYNRVQVRWDGTPIADFPVINDREHQALMDKQTKVQNRVVGTVKKVREAAASPSTTREKIKKIVKKVSGKKAAKKASKKTAKAPKKAAPKKAAPKKAAPKKAAKKSAKKVSPLKKLVKKLVKKLTPAKKPAKKKSKKKR